jgi:hypothetical protein
MIPFVGGTAHHRCKRHTGEADVLVGGSHRTISLQPLSIEGQVGINLALGVAGLTLY